MSQMCINAVTLIYCCVCSSAYTGSCWCGEIFWLPVSVCSFRGKTVTWSFVKQEILQDREVCSFSVTRLTNIRRMKKQRLVLELFRMLELLITNNMNLLVSEDKKKLTVRSCQHYEFFFYNWLCCLLFLSYNFVKLYFSGHYVTNKGVVHIYWKQ